MDKIGSILDRLGYRSLPSDRTRITARLLFGTQTTKDLLKELQLAAEKASLSPEERAEITDFLNNFIKQRDSLLKSSKPNSQAAKMSDFRAGLSTSNQAVLDRLQMLRADPINSKQGFMEQSVNQIFITSLENAGLTKDQFIEKLSPLHGYTMDQLLKNHMNMKSPLKIFIAISSTLTIALDAASGDGHTGKKLEKISDDLSGADLKLLFKLLSIPFEDPKTIN